MTLDEYLKNTGGVLLEDFETVIFSGIEPKSEEEIAQEARRYMYTKNSVMERWMEQFPGMVEMFEMLDKFKNYHKEKAGD